MAEAFPLKVGSEEWQLERIDFICSVVSHVDKALLKAQISKCECEDEVQGIFQSLLLLRQNDGWSQIPDAEMQPPPRCQLAVEEDRHQLSSNEVDNGSTMSSVGDAYFDADDIHVGRDEDGHVDGQNGLGNFDEIDGDEVDDESSRDDDAVTVDLEEDIDSYDDAVTVDLEEDTDSWIQIEGMVALDYRTERRKQLQVEIINDLFAGADPDFLQEKIEMCLSMEGDPQKFIEYVEELLKLEKYPTMKDYRRKMREEAINSEDAMMDDLIDLEDEKEMVDDCIIECPICVEDKLLNRETFCCNALKSEHIYCHQCIERYLRAQIEIGYTTFKCMDDGCSGEFTLRILKGVLEPPVLKRVLEQRQHEDISAAAIENLECCPFCSYKVIIENPQEKVLQCLNPQCMTDSCRLCKEESHLPLRCDEIERDPQKEARKKLENKMAEAMIRECPQCKKRFVKEAGCNNMTCSCGASICYYCRQLTSSVKHKSSSRCNQVSDEKVIHAREVRDAALQGKMEMDPGIELVYDPTKGIL